jgi:ferredoxin
MAYKITDDCISCGSCIPECLNQATIETDKVYKIDPNRCTECVGIYESQRCAQICPVDCCVPDPDHVETKGQLLEKWHKLHPGETPAEGTY